MNSNGVLAKGILNAADQLGLGLDQLGLVLGVDYNMILQLKANQELDPASKQGQQALLLIRIFQSLYALNGGNIEWIRHFMNSPNLITGGIPIEQIQQKAGLIKVLESVQSLLSKN